MKRIFIFIALIVSGLTAMSQNTSPLVVKDFSLKSNEIIDKEQIPKANRTDLDNHPICRIKVKAEGFEEDLMQKFVFVPNGLEITHSVFKNGMWYLHVSSKKNGEITIKYMGDCVFRLPYQLAPGKVYELTLGMETATLIIRSVPMEADIYVDGRKVGTGYGSQAVSIGAEHRYKVTCDGYYPKESNVIFDKKEEKTLDVELELGSGFITITTDPSGADIYIDEVKVGTTPYRVKKIKLGQHSLEIKKYGYVSVADVVTIRKGDHNKQFDNIKLEVDPTAPKVINSPYYGKDENSTAPSVNSSNGTLVGKFSVSDGKQVYFSKGNLQYQASTNTWRFAENQWDIIGEDNKKISSTYNGWIDLFGWGTSGKNHGAVAYQPYSTSDKDSDYYPYGNSTYSLFNKDWSADWGSNAISNGGNMGGIWRTLTIEEWKYLFEQRQTKSGILFAKAVVGGENGVILLPDNWDASVYKLKNTNDKNSVFDGNIISPFEWNKIEAAGAVFLPAGGYRNFNYNKTVNVDGVGSRCYYWSSSKRRTDKIDSQYTCTIDISNDHMWYWGHGESRGYSVRLVRPAD